MDVETEDLHKPVEKCTEKKPRRRMKATYTKIREQVRSCIFRTYKHELTDNILLHFTIKTYK